MVYSSRSLTAPLNGEGQAGQTEMGTDKQDISLHPFPATWSDGGRPASTDTESGGSTLADLLAEIGESQEVMVLKIGTATIDVNLLRTDFRKVVERVSTAEANVAMLHLEVNMLNPMVTSLQSQSIKLEEELEDSQGCSHRNTLRLVGSPERAEGQSDELFI
ncbi:hypothetical protein NDU88_005631 [Pleurodeles waltl]|uniref:Uncharacterized protein n=1 Tax=Pleurodeles waltl TaxID=8319 RepID=A0AAV7ULM4_PLEWA|nr:hypothetical protein NDU88_005631 [Pleurodeles waltl]